MTYEKLSEEFDKKLINANFKILTWLASLLLKPFANATDPFFRKKLGDRYFNQSSLILGFLLWGTAVGLNNFGNKATQWVAGNGDQTLAPVLTWKGKAGATLGSFCIGAFVILGAWNIATVRQMRYKGEPWYSVSRGESLFGSENRLRDAIITGVATLVFFGGGSVLGLFFLGSRISSYYLANKQRESLMNSILDRIDADIHDQFLQSSLEAPAEKLDSLVIRKHAGLRVPLPKGYKGEARSKVARTIAVVRPVEVAAAPSTNTDSSVAETARAWV